MITDLRFGIQIKIRNPQSAIRIKRMSDQRSQISNSQTVLFGVDDFEFEALEQNNGVATVVKFKLDEQGRYNAGDVLVVLSGTEIHFHGMIGKIEDGYAIASDPRGSLLPATTQ